MLKSSTVALDNPISSKVHHVNGNFLFDFRTSTLSIDRTAFLYKVLVDFVPHGSQECGERPVSRLAGSRRLKMLFSPSILYDPSPCVPGAVIEIRHQTTTASGAPRPTATSSNVRALSTVRRFSPVPDASWSATEWRPLSAAPAASNRAQAIFVTIMIVTVVAFMLWLFFVASFLRNHAAGIASLDLFVVRTVSFKLL